MQFSNLELLFGTFTSSVAAGILRFIGVALWIFGTIFLLREFLTAMVTPLSQTSWGLLAADPHVTYALAIVAMREIELGFYVSTFIMMLRRSVSVKICCDFSECGWVTGNGGRETAVIETSS
jgi:hypothetical protein